MSVATDFTRTVELARISDYPAYFARVTPLADALVTVTETVGYQAFDAQIDAVARAMLAVGVRRGDRVAMLAPPCPQHLVHFMAAGRIGAAWVGLNPRHTVAELDVVLRDAAPRVVVVMPEVEGRSYAEDFAELRRGGLGSAVLVSTDVAAGDLIGWEHFVSQGAAVTDDAAALAAAAVESGDTALIVYTSGTTGTPKGAMLSHRSIVTTARIQCEHWWAEPFRILNNLPINHIGGAVQLACHALVAGGANVLMPRFDPVALPSVIREQHVTVMHQVPTMYQLLLDRGRPSADDLAGLQTLVWSGAAAPRALIAALRGFCPRLYTSFGQTETGGEVLYSPAGASDDDLAVSVGLPEPRLEVRLGREDGTDGTADGSGEVQVRGATVMSGYLNRPLESVEAFTADGWLHTGDLAEIDADGRYRIVGRLREMFKSGGYNVYPREVESALERHPAVAMAAVLGVTDEVFGEVGEAWVLAGDGEVSESELVAHCRSHLANYKIPKRIRVHRELPMLPIGKIDKAALRLARSALSAQST